MLIIRVRTDRFPLVRSRSVGVVSRETRSKRHEETDDLNFLIISRTLHAPAAFVKWKRTGRDFPFEAASAFPSPRPSCNQTQQRVSKNGESRTNPWIIEANEYSCCRGIFVTRMYEIRWTLPNNLGNLNGMHISNSIPLVLIRSVRHSVVEYYFRGADVINGGRVFSMAGSIEFASLTVRSYTYILVYLFVRQRRLYTCLRRLNWH